MYWLERQEDVTRGNPNDGTVRRGSFDPDNGNTGVWHCQVCIRVLTYLPANIHGRGVQERVFLAVNDRAEPGPPAVGPISHAFARRAPLPAAPVSVYDFEEAEAGRIPDGFPCVKEGRFDIRGTPRRVCDVDRQEEGAHGMNRRRRSEFETTLTELRAIAPAATAGVRRPSAASGMAITL